MAGICGASRPAEAACLALFICLNFFQEPIHFLVVEIIQVIASDDFSNKEDTCQAGYLSYQKNEAIDRFVKKDQGQTASRKE